MEEKKRICGNCIHCWQLFTGDAHPEFGCKAIGYPALDFMGYPTIETTCDEWESK